MRERLRRVRLNRLTLGSICSYPQALHPTEQKLGDVNPISTQLDRARHRTLEAAEALLIREGIG